MKPELSAAVRHNLAEFVEPAAVEAAMNWTATTREFEFRSLGKGFGVVICPLHVLAKIRELLVQDHRPRAAGGGTLPGHPPQADLN